MPTTTTASTVATEFSRRLKASAASLVVSVPPVLVLVHPENGLDELEDALQAVSVTELDATLLLPSVMVMVAT